MAARAVASAATERRILDVGLELFGELPFDQVSLQAVAERAGVTVQTVIRRFSSKQDLFAAVMTRLTTGISGGRDAAPVGDVAEAVANTVDAYERWGDQILNLLAQEQRTPAIREITDFGRRHHYGWIERVFEPILRRAPSSERARRTAQLIATLDLYVWKVLRRDLGLSRDETEAAVLDLVTRITGAGPSGRA